MEDKERELERVLGKCQPPLFMFPSQSVCVSSVGISRVRGNFRALVVVLLF